MKAEEKPVASMFFSVMQFVYSLGENRNNNNNKKKRIWGRGKGVERDKSRGTGSSGRQQGTPVKNNRRGPNIIK